MGLTAQRMVNVEAELAPVGAMQAITVGAAVKQVDPISKDAQYVLVTIDGGGLRVRFDGTDPDAGTGLLYPDGARFIWRRDTAIKAKFIRATADVKFHAQPMSWGS